MMNGEFVKMVEVGPRDGLQNEATLIPTATKVELIERLLNSGVIHIEASAFVSPKWVPQMADAHDVISTVRTRNAGRLYPHSDVILSALVPNEKGMLAAIQAGAHEVVIFGSASEAFAQKNINCSIDESIARFKVVADLAKAHQLRLRGSISCCLGCPYQGAVSTADVLKVVQAMQALGVDEIDIADTIGVGTARQVKSLMQAVAQVFPIEDVAGHFHDTYGQAVTNIFASLEADVRTFHSSIAGLGGCPYAKGATGNVATEDVVYLLHGVGMRTGLNLEQLAITGDWISGQLGRPSASKAGSAIARCLQ